jgi:hypothetical protein
MVMMIIMEIILSGINKDIEDRNKKIVNGANMVIVIVSRNKKVKEINP